MDEYSTEKFIEQYEHIKKLELLSDKELIILKKKRTKFEVNLKSSEDIKPYLEYITYEYALMKKFRHIKYENELDGRALDRAVSLHVKDIFTRALRRFQEDRNLWDLFLDFTKQKFPNTVTRNYQDMLGFHHNIGDYKEAVRFEMDRQNYFVAINFLIQGMNNQDYSQELVPLLIECSLQEKLLDQATKYYEKFLKDSDNINVFVDLLKRIQDIKISMALQNDIISQLIAKFCGHPQFWKFMANRYLDGYFYENDEYKDTEPQNISFETRLKYALSTYVKSLSIVDGRYRKEMYEIYIDKLLELDSLADINETCAKYINDFYIRALESGFKEDCLPEINFIDYFTSNVRSNLKSQKELEAIITKGSFLYTNSLDFYDVAFTWLYSVQKYEIISTLFKRAVKNNEDLALELIKLLSDIYSQSAQDKVKVIKIILETIDSSHNKKLVGKLQPYILEYCSLTDGVQKTREMYTKVINSKHAVSLSLDFFDVMIEIEKNQAEPSHKIIQNCFDRATMLFGTENPQLWLEYIKYKWDNNQFSEADSIRKRAMKAMKNPMHAEKFELEYTLLSSSS